MIPDHKPSTADMGSVPDIHSKVSSLWLLLKVTTNTINPPNGNRNDKSEREKKKENKTLNHQYFTVL